MTHGALTQIVACITVTYNPDINLLTTQLNALPPNALKIIVDNASSAEIRDELQKLITRTPNAHAHYNVKNLGLAAALNQGARTAQTLAPETQYILLLDQDSEPLEGSISTLISGFESLRSSGEHVGAVGPTLRDADTGLTHGFHQQTTWRWRRVYPALTEREPVPCTNLNGSGTLMPLSLFLELGGLDEALFIDHVDTEWSFRILAAGYTLWGIPQAVFVHRMGQASIRYWLFGWRLWPSRSPQRHYYLFRNAVWLMQRNYVSQVWKLWACAKLVLTALLHGLFDNRRSKQLNLMIGGIRDGLASSPKLKGLHPDES